MNNADILAAALRQTAAGKADAKGGTKAQADDDKKQVDHFREQLRLASKEQKAVAPHVVNASAAAKPAEATQRSHGASVLAESAADAGRKPNVNSDRDDDDNRDDDRNVPKAAGGDEATTKYPAHWRGPDIVLSAVISRLDHAQTSPPGGHESASPLPVAAVDIKAKDVPVEPARIIDVATADMPAVGASVVGTRVVGTPIVGTPAVDTRSVQRFVLTVETMDSKALPAVKAVVREQETHFEPVQQMPVLQKIADRIASDLPAVASPDGARAADAPVLDTNKAADSRPVRMMTLELDPPNLGSVTVKMRLAGESVVIHVTADRYETTQMLRQERGALTDAMQSAGYTFDIASIDHTRTSDPNLNNGQQQQQQAPSDQRSPPSQNGSQADSSASGRSFGDPQGGARQNRHSHEQSPKPPERQHNQNGGRARSGTVYL